MGRSSYLGNEKAASLPAIHGLVSAVWNCYRNNMCSVNQFQVALHKWHSGCRKRQAHESESPDPRRIIEEVLSVCCLSCGIGSITPIGCHASTKKRTSRPGPLLSLTRQGWQGRMACSHDHLCLQESSVPDPSAHPGEPSEASPERSEGPVEGVSPRTPGAWA